MYRERYPLSRWDGDLFVAELDSHDTIMIKSDCVHHKDLITRSLRLDVGEHKIHVEKYHLSFIRPYLYIMTNNSPEHEGLAVSLRIVHDPQSTRPQGYLRLHTNWIQGSLPRKWKEYCDRSHTGSCASLLESVSTVRPAWLVDTRMGCLVPFSGHKSYVALSYVWGGVQQYKTLSSNLELLQRPRSLSKPDGPILLPATIRDAMGWVQALDERYLWVDSLCIVQDALEHKASELDKMSGIYANSSVTIVAADGCDASHGLRGLKGVSKPRSIQQRVYSLGKVKFAERSFPPYVPFPSYYRSHNPTNIWQARGWTFQESLFSRRRLIFEADCVRWECAKGRFLEEDKPHHWRKPELNAKDHLQEFQSLLRAPYPDVHELILLLMDYKKRELTYPEDILRAFSGIAYALSASFPGGFVSGLPAGFFSIALLWRNWKPSSRRKATTAEAQLHIPSWSWAGWEGDIIYTSWTAAESWMKQGSRNNMNAHGLGREVDEVTSLCQWRYKQRTSDVGILIRDFWQEYRSKYMSDDPPRCPPGWIRHRCSEDGDDVYRNPATRNRKWFYKNRSDPYMYQFWFPLPLGPNAVATPMIDAPFISCQTRSTFLYISETISSCFDMLLFALHSGNGDWMGVLQPDEGTFYEGQGIQLVEIALGKRWYCENRSDGRSRIEELAEGFRPKVGEAYEFYHVMWVEMVDGIGYRKGMGEVYRPAWEALDRDIIELTLN